MTKFTPATPEQVAKYGRTAALLRQALQDHNMTKVDLSTKLGYKKHAGHIYNWLASKGAPGIESQKKLAKLFGNKPEDWKGDSLHPGVSTKTILSLPKPVAPDRILSFNMLSNGQAKLQLDVTGDAEMLKTLLNHILQLRLT